MTRYVSDGAADEDPRTVVLGTMLQKVAYRIMYIRMHAHTSRWRHACTHSAIDKQTDSVLFTHTHTALAH